MIRDGIVFHVRREVLMKRFFLNQKLLQIYLGANQHGSLQEVAREWFEPCHSR